MEKVACLRLTPLTTCRSIVTVGLSTMKVPSMTGTKTKVPQKAEEATLTPALKRVSGSTATRQANVS